MAYDFTGYQTQLGTLMALTSADPASPPTDPYFLQILPSCIDYAEQRIYRELDIQSTTTNTTVVTTAGTPFVPMPYFPDDQTQQSVYVVESMSISATANGAPPLTQDTMLTPVDKGFLMSTYPPAYWSSAQGQPKHYYIQDQQTAQVGPCPDQAYQIYLVFTHRPTPLSATNTETILTQIWPDLFLAASMIFMSGYQKNFGSQSDDPKMAASWEDQYQMLLKGALTEEAQKKAMSVSYTPLRAAPFAEKAPGQ
jgi:hypothetical protein